ncbi:MAG: PD-(D/E)XK nuclease family protein [Acidobacteria bacterium]|nr:PD-(D/E)XK nuclease family protein [Acidobacteriota bacterium]
MSKEIWLGPILGGHRARLINRCASLLDSGPATRLLYLAASYPLLESVSTRLLASLSRRALWGAVPVYLFRGFVRRLLATALEEDTGLPLAGRGAIDREVLPLARSLISRIVRRLTQSGRIRAFAPLASNDGCINSIAGVIGEIQRAGITPEEFERIVERRSADHPLPSRLDAVADATSAEELPAGLRASHKTGHPARQIDFDREIGLVYSLYHKALEQFRLTEVDADQLRAIAVLRGEINGQRVRLPWLEDVQLLVLDGFFDFTPAQGLMLRWLIPRVPEVIVNVNWDERNPEIFSPFRETLDQLRAMAAFEIRPPEPSDSHPAGLAALKLDLFNSARSVPHSGNEVPPPDSGTDHTSIEASDSGVELLECSDRATEVRSIAREIKRLVLIEKYALGEMVLIVRERSSYADTIQRIFADEGIPTGLEPRIPVTDVPAVRAAVKLLRLMAEGRGHGARGVRAGELADVLKTGYFQPSRTALAELNCLLKEVEAGDLIREEAARVIVPAEGPDSPGSARTSGAGRWDVDALENVIAYVGSDLSIPEWIARARKLYAGLTPSRSGLIPLPSNSSEDETFAGDGNEAPSPDEEAEEWPATSQSWTLRRREIHPLAIAWAKLVVEHLRALLVAVPSEGRAQNLSAAILSLFRHLQYGERIARPLSMSASRLGLDQIALDLRGLEGLRRALAAAAKAFEISDSVLEIEGDPGMATLPAFVEEAQRCLRAQTLRAGTSDPAGLAVLEATDIRGLRFPVVFLAGLVEGGFPLRAGRDWIYPHEERERLKEYGLTLEDISPATLLKEEHYLYQVACRASERLYLSRPVIAEDGTETVASYFIEEIEHALAPRKICRRTIRSDYDGNDLLAASTGSELATAISRQEERCLQGDRDHRLLTSAELGRLISWSRDRGHLSDLALRRIRIGRERAGQAFGPFDGRLDRRELFDILEASFGCEHTFSASELNLYGNCPYKFFAERILKLEPRVEAALDLAATEEGQLLHEALRRFFSNRRGRSLLQAELVRLQEEMGGIADEIFDEHASRVPPLNPRIRSLDREIHKIILNQVVAYERELQQRTQALGVVPTFVEWAFGMKSVASDPESTSSFLEIQRRASPAAGEAVRLRGQIDRIDLAEDGTTIAYDYKRSGGSGVNDMKAGRDLQLGIYLEAVERLLRPGQTVAGGGYYLLRGSGERRNKGLYRAALKAYTQIGLRGGKVPSNLSEEDWQGLRQVMLQHIWSFIDRIRTGDFRPVPSLGLKTCSHCDFSAVCRYEPYRIRQKDARWVGSC